MKKRLESVRKFIPISLIAIIGFILRIANLTALPIFADEAIYVRWAQVMRAEETLRFLPLSDGKQPLYMWMMIPFLKVFSNPLVAGRILSAVCGVATIIGVYLISKRFFKLDKVANITALIVAVSPFLFFFDRTALVDSMLTAFAVWLFYLVSVNAVLMRLDLAMITGAFLGGALLTKSPGLFFALMLPFSALLVDWPKEKKLIVKKLLKYLFLISVTLFIGFIISNILRLGPNYSMLSSRNMDYVYPYSHILSSPLSPLMAHLGAVLEYFWKLGPWAILILFVVGMITTFRSNYKNALWLFLWIAFPLLAVCEYGKGLNARYVLYIVPFVIILAGSSFNVKKTLIVKGLTVVLLFLLLQSTVFIYRALTDIEKANLPRSERSGYLEEWTAGYGIKEASDFVRQEYLKDTNRRIVVGTEGYFGTLPDGMQLYLNDLPQLTVIGIGLGIDNVPVPLAESYEAGNLTYLVVNNNRLLADPDKAGLKLVAAYPKAVKPDGSREVLFLFQVGESKTKGENR